jgi:DNA repair exonuclease SbcCD ATPase subunit|nr:MAG TPA: Baseplate wedge protein [Caudoviricetes sp.]
MYTSKYYTVEEIDERLKQGYLNDATEQGFVGTMKEFWALFLSIANKVDKKEGYGLSQEDFTTELKDKLNSLSGEIPTKVSQLENDLKFQTKEEVEKYISDLIDGADGALDTLKELADALNNDPNFATNLTNKLIEIRDALTAEVNRAKAAEAALQEGLNEVDAKIEKALQGLTDTIDKTIKDIKDSVKALEQKVDKNTEAISNVKVEVAGQLADFKVEVHKEIDLEKERAITAENALQREIDSLKNGSSNDKAELEQKIQQEATERARADEALQQNIDNEAKARELSEEEIKKAHQKDIERIDGEKVKWDKFPTSELPNRKGIVLENGDLILGKDLNGDTLPLVQLNRWGIIDAGSPKAPYNINTPQGVRPTVQEAGQTGEQAYHMAYQEDLANISAEIDEKVKAEADARKAADELLVKKEEGKELSSNDFTDELKAKLEGIEEFANRITNVSQLVNDSKFQTEEEVKAAIEGIIGSAPDVLDTLKEIADALGNDPNFATTITKKLAALAEQINQEVEDRTNAVSQVQGDLDTKYQELSSKITLQTENLNKEISDRKEADTAMKLEITNLGTSLTAFGTELRQIINQNYQTLQQQIRAQDALIQENTQAIQTNLSLIQSLQTKVDTNVSDVDKLKKDLETEVADRKAADTALQEKINTNADGLAKEISDRKAADQVLQQNIDAESQARTQADSQIRTDLSKKIEDEATARTQADTQITQKLDQEIINRKAEGEKLSQRITEESQGHTEAIEDLQAKVTKNTQDITTEVNRATAKENEIAQNLATETQNRSDADSAMQASIKKVGDDLTKFKATKDQANGLASLDGNGKIKPEQLPEGATYSVMGIEKQVNLLSDRDSVPDMEVGDRLYVLEDKKIYTKTVDGWDNGIEPKEDVIYNFRRADEEGRTNITKRWDGKDMTVISETVVLGETQGTAYEGSKGKLLKDRIDSLPNSVVSEVILYKPNAFEENPVRKNKVGINVKRYEKKPQHEEWEFKASTEYDIPVASLEDGGHGGLMSYEDKVLLQKLAASVFPLTLTVTGGGVYRKTTTQTVTVSWSLKQGPDAVTPDSLKINNEPIEVSLTSKQFPGITVNTTFRVEATKEGVTKTGSVSAVFVNPSYFGVVDSNFTPTPEGIQGLSSGEIIKNSKTYNTSAFNQNAQKNCYAYPKVFGALTSITDGKNEFINSYTRSELEVNGEMYYVYVLSEASTVSNYSLQFK